MKNAVNTIVDALVILLFAVSLLVVSMSLTSRSTGIPNLAGYTLFSVQTDSMKPTINTGDLMISRVSDQNDTHELGEVVTFKAYMDRIPILNTHRIVDVKEIDDVTYYVTKGDNASGPDQKELSGGDIVATWNGFRIAKAGKAFDYLRTQKGFMFCVLLPMMFFFLYILYQFIVNLKEHNREKIMTAVKEAASELTEEQKKKAIEEYLAAQKKDE